MLTMNLVLWKAKSGITHADDWTKAAAYFFGSGGASDSEHTVYNRAQKRCKDYGTCMNTGEAKVNALIAQALNSKSDKAASYANIVKQFKVLYSQNVLKYANKIDTAIGTDAIIDVLAEGQAFWRILAPWMSAYDSNAAKVFDRMFSTVYTPQAANNYNYCIAKKYIDGFLAQTSVMGSATDAAIALGTLSEVPAGVTCASDIAHGLVTTITTNAGDYTLKSTDNDIGAALAYSEAVKKVVNLVGGTGTDIATAFESTSLKAIADAGGEDTAEKFATHHGGANWMSAIITDATKAPPTPPPAPRLRPSRRPSWTASRCSPLSTTSSTPVTTNMAKLLTRRRHTGTPRRPSTLEPPPLAATPSTPVRTSAARTLARWWLAPSRTRARSPR